MDDKMLQVVLDEIKGLRIEIKELHNGHQDLKNKVYLISITIGLISGELKHVVERILGI